LAPDRLPVTKPVAEIEKASLGLGKKHPERTRDYFSGNAGSDLERRFVCQGCGFRGADVRRDFERGDGRLAIMSRAGNR
jgi:hypothetical protein